jgi:hypothetical protein
MEYNYKIGICGDVCSECPRYIASMKDDTEELRLVAELWFRVGFRSSIRPHEEMRCYGCSKDKACSHGITTCAFLAENQNCGECQFYPCDRIKAVFDKAHDSSNKVGGCCSETEFKSLCDAFYMKKEILDRIHEQYFTRKRIEK